MTGRCGVSPLEERDPISRDQAIAIGELFKALLKLRSILSGTGLSIVGKNLPTAAVLQRGAWHAAVLVLGRYPSVDVFSRFCFGPDIRDAATPDFIDPLFCAKTYPL